ncbi:MAG: hypothetical protein JXR76_11930 [Deltaproteobacteria bacterium]|nr:hypothetical protein [Deltaproteobacteria bacterium]
MNGFLNRMWPTIFAASVCVFPARVCVADDDGSIVFNYTFEVSLAPEEVVHTIFEFDHLKTYSKGVHSLKQLQHKPGSHVVRYEYRHAMFKTIISFKRILNLSQNEIDVEMLSCWDNVPFLPMLRKMTGRYKVYVNAAGKTVVRYRTVSEFDSSPGRAYRKILNRRSLKFMDGLKEYLLSRMAK